MACDHDAELVNLAQHFWDEADVAERIEARIGDAGATLKAMLTIDLAAELIRVGGLLVADATLIHGRVVTGPLKGDPDYVAPAVDAMRAVNRRLHNDERFASALLPTRDGLTLARKRR